MEGEDKIPWNYSAEWLKSSGVLEMLQEQQCTPRDPQDFRVTSQPPATAACQKPDGENQSVSVFAWMPHIPTHTLTVFLIIFWICIESQLWVLPGLKSQSSYS